MPDFDVEHVSIEPDEFVDACNQREINDLINCLIDNGWIKKSDKVFGEPIRLPEMTFREYMDAIYDNYHSLTNEEEELIIKIGKKFKV